MNINSNVIMKNMGTFTHAYGLEPKSQNLLEGLLYNNGNVESIGVLLRNPITKKALISCQFPVEGDITNHMLWIPINNMPVETVPVFTREVKPASRLTHVWTKLKNKMSDSHFYLIKEGNFNLRVHHSLCKRGVIEKYIVNKNYGFIRRNRKGIFFKNEWCNLDDIQEGKEVSFIPVISHQGLQARAVEDVE